MRMLCPELNHRILKLAPKHTALDIAPNTFKALESNRTASLVVWSGASEQTIYGDPTVNHAARAWHDSLHLKLGADFTVIGETRVAIEQCRLIGSDQYADILWSEIVGQVEYFEKHGSFPIDQVEFIRNYLKGKVK